MTDEDLSTAGDETLAPAAVANGETSDQNDNTASAADGDQDGQAGTEPEKQEKAKPKISERSQRIHQLVTEKNAAIRIAEKATKEAEQLRARLASVKAPSEYSSTDDYSNAVLDATASNAVSKAMAERADAEAREAKAHAEALSKQEAELHKTEWQERTADFRAQNPDFEKVAHNPDLPITPNMAEAIRESERAAEIAYHLGKNPSEAARIAALSPVQQVTAIARLEAKFGQPQPKITSAPPPVTTIKGKSGTAGKSLDDMNFEEYRKARGF